MCMDFHDIDIPNEIHTWHWRKQLVIVTDRRNEKSVWSKCTSYSGCSSMSQTPSPASRWTLIARETTMKDKRDKTFKSCESWKHTATNRISENGHHNHTKQKHKMEFFLAVHIADASSYSFNKYSCFCCNCT